MQVFDYIIFTVKLLNSAVLYGCMCLFASAFYQMTVKYRCL